MLSRAAHRLAPQLAGPASERTSAHWLEIARRWYQVGPPLRPSAPDLAACAAVVQCWSVFHGAPRALILGVTPELYHLPWPAGTELAAVDHTPAMIEAVWPGPGDAVLCANWMDLPLESASRDIVLCDGGLHLLAYPLAQQQLVRSLRRIVAPGGLCIFRLFVPPVQREAPESVLRDLLAGCIPSLNVLKLRLAMALQETSEAGVQLAQVWDALHQAAPDFNQLAAQLGWSLDHLLAIDTYRDCTSRYHFLDALQVVRLFAEEPGGFTFATMTVPRYELGERCPTVVFRRVSNGAGLSGGPCG